MPPQDYNQYQDPAPRQSRVSNNPWIVPISIVIAGAFIGAGVFLSKAPPSSTSVLGGADANNTIGDIIINPVTASDHILGDPNAPVKIVEFSDTECPFCKEFQTTMTQIMDTYGKTGKVAWIYRHFPIDQLHTRAHHEAVATECANELGGVGDFWQYIDEVFNRTNSNDTLDPKDLPDIAKDAGLDVGKFNTCLASTKYDNLILQDSQDAVRAGAVGTPYSVLITANGEKVAIKGAEPYDVMKTLIDTALGGTVATPPTTPADESTVDTSLTPAPQLNAY